ncbi:Type IV secretion system protein VirD4 [Deinococcus saxicola]
MVVSFPIFLLRLCCYYVAGFAAIFGVMTGNAVVLAAAAILVVFGTWFFAGRDARFRAMYTAHWATPREIKDATVNLKYLKGDEVMLGYAYNKPLALRAGLAGRKEVGHVLVVGPSRTGKGLHASANLLNWRGSVVTIDIKGEFYNSTAGFRHQEFGQDVFVLNPSTGATSNQFDPFAERDTPEQLQATAEAILNPEADGSNSAFARRASFALVAMMMVAKEKELPVLPFVRDCLRMGPERSLCMLEEMTEDPNVQENLVYFLSCPPSEYNWDGFANDKFANNSWVNLISKMKYLLSQGIIEMTSQSDFKATDLMRKPTSLYMIFRESDLKYTVHSFSAVILAIIEAIIKEYDLHPDEEYVPILFVFDEAGKITVPMLDELISTVAGRGMIALVYVQALAQLNKRYTEDGADTIKANTHTKIYFTPKDEDTAKYLSVSGGKYMIEDQRTSKGDEQGSDTVGFSARELITPDEALKMGVGRCIIASNEFEYIAGYRMEPFVMPNFDKARQLPPPSVKKKVRAVAANSASAAQPESAAPKANNFDQVASLGLTLDSAPTLKGEDEGSKEDGTLDLPLRSAPRAAAIPASNDQQQFQITEDLDESAD